MKLRRYARSQYVPELLSSSVFSDACSEVYDKLVRSPGLFDLHRRYSEDAQPTTTSGHEVADTVL